MEGLDQLDSLGRVDAHQLERAASEVVKSSESLAFLAGKVQAKFDFKDRMAEDDGTNDWEDWKRLGMFIVHTHTVPDNLFAVFDYHGLEDIVDREVLELHIPPQRISFSQITQSFDRLAEYLMENCSQRALPEFIYGVSYLAKAAKRWGFNVIDLPAEIRQNSGAARLLSTYSRSEDEGKRRLVQKFQTSDIQMCYISTNQFFLAFESKKSRQAFAGLLSGS